jgi:hypothetical protein
MSVVARWIRLEACSGNALRAACRGIAAGVALTGRPVVLWTRAENALTGDFLAADEGHFVHALVAPERLAPGRPWRWRAWGVAPALATFRHFGAHAYLDDDAVYLNGRKVSGIAAEAISGCAVTASSFLPQPPQPIAPWLERDLEMILRLRFEAQHGWEFENCWPTAAERTAIADATVA